MTALFAPSAWAGPPQPTPFGSAVMLDNSFASGYAPNGEPLQRERKGGMAVALPLTSSSLAPRTKSLKRKAAEALLASRHSPLLSSRSLDSPSPAHAHSSPHLSFATLAAPLSMLGRSQVTPSRGPFTSPSSSPPATPSTASAATADSDRQHSPSLQTRAANPASRRPSVSQSTCSQQGQATPAAQAPYQVPQPAQAQRQQQQQQQQQQRSKQPGVKGSGGKAPPGPSLSPSSQAEPRLVAQCPAGCAGHSMGWCTFGVKLHHINWQSVFDQAPATMMYQRLDTGLDKYFMAEGLVVYNVEEERHAAAAVKELRASMTDRLLSIDLEWRPERVSGQVSKVALMQLSSATVCLLLRVNLMNYSLPAAVKELLASPDVTIMGFAWENSDEQKMQRSFSIGRANFGSFLDLQVVASKLGYQRPGLSKLTKQVLGLNLVKSRSVSMSNWAAQTLNLNQIKYAALDVFAAAQVFRGLRLWHACQSSCPECSHPVGQQLEPVALVCGSTGKTFPALNAYQLHCSTTGQEASAHVCPACHRLVKKNKGAKTALNKCMRRSYISNAPQMEECYSHKRMLVQSSLQSSVDAAWSSHACCGVAGSCQQESLQPRDSLPAEYMNMNYRCMSSSAWAAAGCRCVAVQVAAGCRCAAVHEQQRHVV
ncbi:hypothetical protein QJQ45_030012, partial [Haematococcus lacustris]